MMGLKEFFRIKMVYFRSYSNILSEPQALGAGGPEPNIPTFQIVTCPLVPCNGRLGEVNYNLIV
jgi:hypothetical protein